MEPDVPIARRLDTELIEAANSPPVQLSSPANSLTGNNHDHLAVSSSAVYVDPTANSDLVGAPSRQWNTTVQEDAAPATRIPSILSGTIVEGHYAWEPYEEKTQDLIRKECSLRQIKLNTKTKKSDRITCLRRYDELMNSGESSLAASTMAAGGTRRTKHCTFRLTNVVLSDNLFMRLIEATGENFDRADLDDVQSSVKNQFWRDVATAYHSNDEAFRGLINDDPAFGDIDPGIIVPHSPTKLEDLWKELTSFYSICSANFRLSGTHEREFKQFVQGKMDVLYLWYWLKVSLHVVTEPSLPTFYLLPL
eukprot:jgi/Phyca11/133301/e_gw1.408.2.1